MIPFSLLRCCLPKGNLYVPRRSVHLMRALIPSHTDPNIARHVSPAEGLKLEEVDVPQVREDKVLVRVRAIAINRADILQRKGLYPPPPGVTQIPGLECAGEIAKIGPSCKRGFKEDESNLIHIPSKFSFEEAAAIPEVWITAFQLLYWIVKAQANEYVLIHAGASGVGLAAIQLATCIHFGAKQAFNYKEQDLSVSDNVRNVAIDGVHVILDCVGASMWNENVKSLREDGSFYTTTLRGRTREYKTNLVKDFEKKILPRLVDGTCVPVIDKVFDGVSNVAEAHAYVEANANIGKVVVKWTHC
ncbi:Quinone oxidoreductase PIG3 [Galdieria sulphuraria]|nr:Quinone oxidoreductase PIG3 [Galdieria sulphuraria]